MLVGAHIQKIGNFNARITKSLSDLIHNLINNVFYRYKIISSNF